MNRVILKGRLTADPEIKYSQGENANANCRFSVAVNRNFKNKDGNYDADFINCVAFRNQAEFLSKYFHKGDEILLEGNIRTGSYTNRDGNKVYTTDVYVDAVEFCGSKGNGNAATAGASTPATKSAGRNDFMTIPDDADDEGLPFN